MHSLRALSALVVVLALIGCSEPESAANTEPATEASGASPAAPPAAAPLQQRMLGRWPMAIRAALESVPAAQRADTMTMYYSLCRDEPTVAELEAAGISSAARLGVYLARSKVAQGEADEGTARLLAGPGSVRSRLPTFEFLEGNIANVHIGAEVSGATYTVSAETAESLTITVVEEDDTDGPETFVVTMEGDDVLLLTKSGEAENGTITLARDGTDDPMDAPQVSAIPTGVAVPPGLLGRWNPNSGNASGREFRADNTYLLHGAAPLEGHYWVTAVEGNQVTLRAQLGTLPHQLADAIEVTLEGDSMTWQSVAGETRTQMTRQP